MTVHVFFSSGARILLTVPGSVESVVWRKLPLALSGSGMLERGGLELWYRLCTRVRVAPQGRVGLGLGSAAAGRVGASLW